MPRPPLTVLAEAEWLPRAGAHAARMAGWTGPHAERRRAGVAHPVLDFLFTYYSETPGRLARWHPGVGTALAGPAARERLGWPFHTEHAGGAVGLDPDAFLAARGEVVARVGHLLRSTAGRPAQFGCFGLHEWAMVYRPDDGEVRHGGVPLRLGVEGTAEVVDRHRVQCSHFDAYRFFSRRGRPLNTLRPTRATQPDLEQPGCLHATMDLYKWAYKLSPAVPGELLADCLALAVDVRELDMRASPYDLRDHGYEPVAIETPEGKAQYVTAQRTFADRGAALRRRLISVCDGLLADARSGAVPSQA
ncbi:3-methyladenine DNA glycosylase [Blastococcus sp. SYSU DS0539]